ncbi:MAG: tetratricopeptide repeat protein [Acidobacteriota bacterium]
MKCTDPAVGRLITRYELGMLDEGEREAFVDHMWECAYCHEEVFAMAPHMATLRNHRQAVLRGAARAEQIPAVDLPQRMPPAWAWRGRAALLAASVLLVAGGAVTAYFVLSGRGSGSETRLWTGMVVPKAAYVPPASRPVLRGAGGWEAFDEGMASYLKQDYASASKQLEVTARLDPENAEAHFYQGVSLVLMGQAADAIGPLKRAAETSAGMSLERARYYLALAYLGANKPDAALDELRKIIDSNGELRRQAERLKAIIERSTS